MNQKIPSKKKNYFYIVIQEPKAYIHGAFKDKKRAVQYKKKLEDLHGGKFSVIKR